MASDVRAAWLAGLLDGEGSIGIGRNVKPGRRNPVSLRAAVQMSTTHEPTLAAALEVLIELGVKGARYTYQERDPANQQNAYFLRVVRLVDIRALAEAMVPHAVTKRTHWALILEYAGLRLAGVRIDPSGRVMDRAARPHGPREWEIAEELRRLNLRGAAAIARDREEGA